MISKLINPYFLSQIISATVAVVLLPIITRIMPQDEVGYYAELISFAFFVSVIIKFGSHQAILVFLNQTTRNNEEILEFSRSFALPFINFSILSLVMVILSLTNTTPWIYILACPYALADILFSNRLNYLRFKNHRYTYLSNTALLAFVTLIITIISIKISPTAKYRLIAVIYSYIIVIILFHRQSPKLILSELYNKASYLKYMSFGVWLSLMWLLVEFFNWFTIYQISDNFSQFISGRFSVLKTMFYQFPAILISVFDLIFIDKYYKQGDEYFKKHILKYVILLVSVFLLMWVISFFLEKDLLIFVTGDENYFRNDNWISVFFATLISRVLIFRPLYKYYKNKQTIYVFLSYLLSYIISYTIYNFFETEVVFTLILFPMILLNIFLRIVKNVKI